MSQNKRFKEISTDDLLNYIEDANLDDTGVIYNDNSLMGFVDKFGLVPGENTIKADLLYKLYKTTAIKPLNPHDFHAILKVYLSYKDNYYYINNQRHKINLLALETLKTKQLDQSTNTQDYIKFNKFLAYYDIKAGTDKFSLDMYDCLYILYTRKLKKKKLSKEKLSYLLTKSFKTKIVSNKWFYTNNFINNMSVEDRKELLKLLQNVTKETKNTQRQKEICWLKQKCQS